MKARKNILFSTTRQWNPGDEFILKGIMALFRDIGVEFNPFIFNRNPELKHPESRRVVHVQIDIDKLRVKRMKSAFYDNSFKKELVGEKFIDLAVFAGTAEWASSRMKIFYEFLDRHSIPALFFGIGCGDRDFDLNHVPELYRRVMGCSPLITTRNQFTAECLSRFGAIHLPCPSLLSAPRDCERAINKVTKVGLIYATSRSMKSNRISPEAFAFLRSAYDRLLAEHGKEYGFEFVSHYINEVPEFQKDFPGQVVHYSYDSEDYFDIYNRFDLVLGPRVHGIGIAASMGIPGIAFKHDDRGETCQGFDAEIIDVKQNSEDVLAVFQAKVADIAGANKRLLAKKRVVFEHYKQKLVPILEKLDSPVRPFRSVGQMRKVLAIRNDRFGEFLLNIPAFRAIKETNPGAELHVIVAPGIEDLAKAVPFIDKVFVWPVRKHPFFWPLALVRKLRREKYDAAVVLNSCRESHHIMFLAGIPRRYGYDQKHAFMLTDKIEDEKNLGLHHEVDNNLHLVGLMGAATRDKSLCLRLPEGMGVEVVRKFGLDPSRGFIAVHPWTSDPLKQWPLKNFKELIVLMAQDFSGQIMIIGRPEPWHEEIDFSDIFRVVDLQNKTTLLESAVLLSQCRCLISGDSGPVHLACSVQTPVVALFRNDIPGKGPRRWGPWGEGHIVVQKSKLEDILVGEVIAKIKQLVLSKM